MTTIVRRYVGPFLLLLLGCVRPTEERAERDLEVGKADVGGVSFRVAGGVAAVRAATPGELRLWNSAPAYTLTAKVAADGQRDWTIHVENALPNLELSAAAENSTVFVTPVTGQGTSKSKSWTVSLPQAVTTTLRLAPPDQDSSAPFEFGVMSDVQEAIDDVHDIYEKANEYPELKFMLGAGDLTEQGSEAQLTRFANELERMRIPYYTTLGNHELGADPPPYQDLFGRGSFRFVYRGVQFTLLDSASASIDPMVYDWLDGWLEEGKNRVHVVGMHIPPIDPIGVRNGSFASRNEAAKLLTRLAKGRVDLTVYGHIHSYYEFENAGIPAHISGGGGAIPERFDGIGRHFLVVDVDPKRGITDVRVVRVD